MTDSRCAIEYPPVKRALFRRSGQTGRSYLDPETSTKALAFNFCMALFMLVNWVTRRGDAPVYAWLRLWGEYSFNDNMTFKRWRRPIEKRDDNSHTQDDNQILSQTSNIAPPRTYQYSSATIRRRLTALKSPQPSDSGSTDEAAVVTHSQLILICMVVRDTLVDIMFDDIQKARQGTSTHIPEISKAFHVELSKVLRVFLDDFDDECYEAALGMSPFARPALVHCITHLRQVRSDMAELLHYRIDACDLKSKLDTSVGMSNILAKDLQDNLGYDSQRVMLESTGDQIIHIVTGSDAFARLKEASRNLVCPESNSADGGSVGKSMDSQTSISNRAPPILRMYSLLGIVRGFVIFLLCCLCSAVMARYPVLFWVGHALSFFL